MQGRKDCIPLFVSSGLGGMSGAQPKAGNIAGVVSVIAEINPKAAEKRYEQGWVDELHTNLDELIPAVRKAVAERRTVSMAYVGNVVDLWERLANEDIEGRPFVGRSGQLLQSLLASYGFSDEDYHICNICKCRPPQNRRPEPSEISACKRLLAMQFRLVRPKVILLCGSTAYEGFFGQKVKMGDVRGRFIENNGYYIMTTYHPAYALRDPKQKIPIYEDMGKVRAKLEELGIFKPLEPLNPNA